MFGEKKTEKKNGKSLPVWQSPKYEQSKKKALEIINKYDNITEADFWILMNTCNGGDTMMYSGLIISHNGCLKINETLPEEKRFDPAYLTRDKEGYGGALVYEYNNPKQKLYEVGEVSARNCKNEYPYAMAYKRCFDRVVLKMSGLAYEGVYSDSEADEFKRDYNSYNPNEQKKAEDNYDPNAQITKLQADTIRGLAIDFGITEAQIRQTFGVASIEAMSNADYVRCKELFDEEKEKQKK